MIFMRNSFLLLACFFFQGAVLANPCAEAFIYEQVDPVLEKLANNQTVTPDDIHKIRIVKLVELYYPTVFDHKNKALNLQEDMERMGFPNVHESTIKLLKNVYFAMAIFSVSKRKAKKLINSLEISEKDKNDIFITEKVPGLSALRALGLSNNQILEMFEQINSTAANGVLIENKLFNTKTIERKKLLEDIGFSEQEVFEFLIKYVTESHYTPFNYKWNTTLETVWSQLQKLKIGNYEELLQILSAVQIFPLKNLENLTYDNLESLPTHRNGDKTEIEKKRFILQEQGLSEETISRIPDGMLMKKYEPLSKGEKISITALITALSSGVYWIFF